MVKRVPVLGEDQELPETARQLLELGPLQAALESLELRLFAKRKRVFRQLDEPLELVHLFGEALDRLGDERRVDERFLLLLGLVIGVLLVVQHLDEAVLLELLRAL